MSTKLKRKRTERKLLHVLLKLKNEAVKLRDVHKSKKKKTDRKLLHVLLKLKNKAVKLRDVHKSKKDKDGQKRKLLHVLLKLKKKTIGNKRKNDGNITKPCPCKCILP